MADSEVVNYSSASN